MIETELPEGWLTEAEAAYLTQQATGKVVIEVGAWLGRSTVALARSAKLVISIDHHRGSKEHQALAQGSEQYAPGLTDPETGEHSTLRRFLANTQGQPNIVPILAPFEQVAHYLYMCELAFIDGPHDHASVLQHGRLAARCLRPGSPLIFHDYGTWAGVVSAVAVLQRAWKVGVVAVAQTSLAVLVRPRFGDEEWL